MRTKLQFLFVTLLSMSFIQAQEVTVNTSMGAGYSNQLFYKLSTQTETSFAANSWDIAMLRTSNMDMALRVNDGIEIYEASNTPSDWDSIDVTNEASWTQLYNSDIAWNNGAFQQGSATYGWGEYNTSTHHVNGTIVFVLKYTDGSYKKFINEDFYGGYTFKYSTWDGTAWTEDQTVTVPNSNNPDNKYNYYSLQNNEEVVAEPAIADWDFKFTKYYTEVAPDTQYPVTGVLHNDAVEVAENDESAGMPADPSLTYSTDINVIGYDWKTFGGTGFVIDSNKAFYIKYEDGTVYRLYFTVFSGSASGDLTFKFEDVTAALGVESVTEGVSFGIYPNPSTDGRINLVYDVDVLNSNKNEVAVYSTTGQQVYRTVLNNDSGFYNKSLDLSSLTKGIYILQFTSRDYKTTKKIVLK
ncbi:T9SS type A sorting domain-containing protein [uncultured Flavobacterium sp.]|uniref:T9SS type A sorting domain-containing protein n=1 Tax=uncultured Flavobacterium sp. TaxID=165435 RepID=UPI0025FAB0B9|nr:T9SS type A sorting domain-containing protein [uncultured Flavobacterium sp.]